MANEPVKDLMFDLETEIAKWRQQMLAAGVETPVPLDELENHLRDQMEQQMRTGLSGRQAFDMAAKEIGGANALTTEFGKIRMTTIGRFMIQTTAILVALFGSVLGGSMLMPALGRWHQTGVLHLWPVVVGCALAFAAGFAALYGVRSARQARGRMLITVAIIAAGAFYTVPLFQAFFLRKTDLAGWVFCALLALASVLFYGACYRFHRRSFSGTPVS